MRIEGTNLPDRWTLTPADHALVAAKSCVNRLSFAVLLLFFRERGRFPVGSSEIDRQMVWEVAQQIDLSAPEDQTLNLTGRTAERHRAEIRALFGFGLSNSRHGRHRPAWSSAARGAPHRGQVARSRSYSPVTRPHCSRDKQ